MADASLGLLMRQQERVLDKLGLVRGDIGDFKADMEVAVGHCRRLDQSIQSLIGVSCALSGGTGFSRQRAARAAQRASIVAMKFRSYYPVVESTSNRASRRL